MSIVLGLCTLLGALARLHEVDCVQLGMHKLNDYSWFIEGQNFTVSCIATGGVNITCMAFHWTFFNDFRHQIMPKMLQETVTINDSVISSRVTLLNATEFSKGTWYMKCLLTTSDCSPSLPDGSSRTTHMLPLQAENLPKVYIGSPNISVNYGRDVNFTCTASVDMYLEHIPVAVSWLKDGKRLKQVEASGPLENFSLALSLRNVTTSGCYMCCIYVNNTLDSHKFEDNQTVFLTVRPRPRILGASSEVHYVIPGQAFQVSCEVSDPLSLVIKWQRKTGDGNYSDISGNHNMTIKDKGRILSIASFGQEDATYVCKAVTEHDGDIFKEFKLIARTQPSLTGPRQKEVLVEPDDDVTLTCDIDVLPLNITWTVHGVVIRGNNSRYRIFGNDPRFLLIKNVDFSGRRSFFCSAKNGLNVNGVVQEIVVRVKDFLAALWPALGILIVAVLLAIVIGLSIYISRRRQREVERREARELKDISLTPSQSGGYGDQEDGVAVGFDLQSRLLTT